MPRPRQFMSAQDISEFMGMSLRSAQYQMAVFRDLGIAIKIGHGWRVDARTFAHWLCDQDGGDYPERLADIRSFLVAE